MTNGIDENGNVSDPNSSVSDEKSSFDGDQTGKGDESQSPSSIGILRGVLPFFVLLVTECLFWFLKSKGVVLAWPIVPMSFGLIKDVLDVFVVAIFPWHGWVSAIPLVAAIFVGADARKLVFLFILSSITTGLIGTFFGFREISAQKFVMGILTYAAINCFVFFTLLTIKFIFDGVRKCLR